MTIFERILSGEIPATKVYEDENVIAINDINPQAAMHILVIPKQKAKWLPDLATWSDEDIGRCFKSAALAAKQLGLEALGYRVIINSGEGGGQTVDYLHMHILAGNLKEFG
ncbi:MAG: histidine triad nucleotide-binding protein [Spirochaetaceae bacterium]|nr:histidine triad nucleotide-binding protein [Spirochaetaceae bacterium]